MNVKIAIRSGLAALLALSLSACDVEQLITFILDPGTGELVAIETPVSWDEPNTQNFEQFDAGEASQRVVLWNVDWDDANTLLVISASDASGVFLSTSSLINFVVDDTGTDLELEIVPGVPQTIATTFVQGLPTNEPSARRLEFRPSLDVDRLDPNIPVIACAEVFYSAISLDLKCEVLF